MYYCKARYYVPLWKRWLTPDNPKYLDENDINNLNLFAYCGNDPANKYDPNGNSPKWLKTLTDIALYIVSGTIASIFAPVVASVTLPTPEVTLLSGLAVFGAVNNFTNAIYYNHISDGKNDAGVTSSSYTEEGYINRWDRLDYVKSQEDMPSTYNKTVRMYFFEYNLHMWGWLFTGWSLDKNIPIISGIADSCKDAYVVVGEKDGRPKVDIPAMILRWLGL